MPDQQRLLQPEPVDEADDDARLLAQARAGAGRAHRIAGTRPVERDEPVAVGQPAEQRMTELMELGAEPMDEDDRPPLARFNVVNAVAVDVDEFAGWRNHFFRMRGDLAGRQHEIACDQGGGDQE